MSEENDWVILGRLGRPHGIKGLISVLSFTDPRENLLSYPDWFFSLDNKWQRIPILEIQSNHRRILARIEGYDQPEEVAVLTHVEIAVPADRLPILKPDEVYWHELIGMKVFNSQDLLLGEVTEVFATGSNDVLVVSGDKRRLIPYLPGQAIVTMDRSLRRLIVDWDADE